MTLAIQAVAFESGENWIAHGVNVNIATQSSTKEGVKKSLVKVLCAYLDIAAEKGCNPLESLGEAREEIRDMYYDSDKLERIKLPRKRDIEWAPRVADLAIVGKETA